MAGTALTYGDYTVGWICALEVEQAAARALFDEEHRRLPSIPGDPNRYRFGCIAGHNVVVACLPDGETGNNPVATVAARMTINFPSLKLGLMVGIGGGVPQPPNFDDIRLGDVVVSSATGDIGGVVQYDRGKTVQDGDFKLTGSLNRPPEVLRQAVTDLRATYRLRRSRLAEYLAQMLSAYNTFASPATTLGLQDTLFRSDYEHPKGPGFATCESCDTAQIVQRSPRSPNPVVHYGIIASGNQVMRNGLKRDEISKKLGGVLCFEMEAAGLMNTFPCLVIRGICDYSDSHKNKEWQAYAAATAAAYTKELLGEVEPAKVDQTQAAAVVMKKLKTPWLVPFERNPHFVGRNFQIRALEEKLSAKDLCRRVAMFGLGGIGKTQIALEFAYRLKERSPGCAVFWVPAITTASFEQAYQEIATLLQILGITEQKIDVKRLVQSRLSEESFGEWLLIIDNADDIDILLTPSGGSNSPRLIDYLPVSPKGSIVFTSRTRKAAMEYGQVDAVEVLNMDLVDAKKILERYLFRKRLLGEDDAVTQLLELLTYLPLAIVQAAAYINKNDISISEYIDLYKTDSEKDIIEILSENFEDRGRYKGTENPIATTWLISFEQIRRQDVLAVEYLSFMACLMRENIPKSLLLSGASKKREIDAIGTLTAYSFIIKRDTQELDTAYKGGVEHVFDMHRLVYLATRNWLRNQSQLSIWADKALIRLVDVVPAGGHQGRMKWTAYLTHAIYVTASLDITDENMEVKITLLDRIGRCQYSIGQYKAAERTHRQTLELREKVLGKEHPSTLTSMNEIGVALSGQGRYGEAERMHRQTLELSEKVLGQEHPSTLTSMSNLALALSDQGRYEEAERMHRQTLELNEKVLGQEHPSTLTSMSNLALALSKQGRYEEAERMHRQTLELKEKVLGQEHPSTLTSVWCLASLLHSRRQYQNSNILYQRACAGYQKILGLEHPKSLSCLKQHASLLEDMKTQNQE